MERRHFLQLAVGLVAGAAALTVAALTVAAQAAPLSPHLFGADQTQPPASPDIHSAVTTEAEVERLKPEEVRWHHHGHWRRRHWGWHRRWHRWHRRHW